MTSTAPSHYVALARLLTEDRQQQMAPVDYYLNRTVQVVGPDSE